MILRLVIIALLLMVPAKLQADDDPAGNAVTISDILLRPHFQYMSGGGDRCSVSHCLCSVRPDPVPRLATTANTSPRRVSLYFNEGSHELTTVQTEALASFLRSTDVSSYTVVGYTDDCGSHEYNRRLVQDRVARVRSSMSSAGASGIDTTLFNAEAGTGHDPAARRVDVIAHTSNRLTTMIDKIQADVYLIDASGSMWTGWKNWTAVVSASFRPGARIYLSKTSGCYNGQRISAVSPSGGTEIWYSYWKVIEWMQPGETLAIISDFQSDIPLTRREAAVIEQKVRERNIKVIAVNP